MSNRVKILMVGPVNGQLSLLSNKLRTLQKSKAGPFDICICAGPFFHQTTTDNNDNDAVVKQERQNIKDNAASDEKLLLDKSLTFDVPVLFVDAGNGLPTDLQAKIDNVKKRDDAEIDLDDDGDDSGDANKTDGENEAKDNDSNNTPEGLLRISSNLYQLVGGTSTQPQKQQQGGLADIISVPLPLIDNAENGESATTKTRQHATSLTIGFLSSRIRLPCNNFEMKSKHTSFLGCDVLISGEWGQGMSSNKCSALTIDDRNTLFGDDDGGIGNMMGSYDVAELIAMSRPRYHIAPGPAIPVRSGSDETVKMRPIPVQSGSDETVKMLPIPVRSGSDETVKMRRRFVASLPYRYPATSSSGGESHAGRFLACSDVMPPTEVKSLGKSFKFIHAVGIVPLAHMDANDREAAMEKASVVDCPYTDASYDVDAKSKNTIGVGNTNSNVGGLSEAHARRLAQEDAASALGGGGDGAFRWQQTRKRGRDGQGNDDDDAKRQAFEEDNPENCSLFLHGLHRDPSMTLTMDVLMDAFRPFGCVGIRFPRPKVDQYRHHQQNSAPPSYAFVDFSTHEEASQCLANLKGEAVIRNIMLSLKWSSSGGNKKRMQQQPQMGIPPPPPPRRNRLTESECADSTTLFLRLPPTVDSSSYEKELEFMRLFAQRTMEDELNVGVAADSADRITAADEPALRVQVRQPNAEMNYGFLTFASHAAALTTLVSLTGHEDGGAVSGDKLETAQTLAKEETETKADSSNLNGVTLYWAKGSQKSAESNGKSGNYGLNFNNRHFPPDARTDCWFCLASPTCEKHLIVTVFDECYVAMPKGAVNEFHSLIVPVEHGGDGAFVTKKLAPEMETVKSKLRTHARTALQKDLFVFERCIQTKGGYHTHVQCIPVEAGSGPAIQSKMLEMSVRSGFQLREITSELSLNALEEDWSAGYFYVEIPLGGGDEYRRFIYRAGDASGNEQGSSRAHVPLQFGREVLAEVLNKPEIGHWKACVVSKEKEEELTASFRTSLASLSS